MTNTDTHLNPEIRKSLYRQMIRIRKFEEKTHELYKSSKLTGMSPHLCIGEEASAAGVISTLNKDDYILSTHRGHGHCLAKGAEMGKMYAELFGKETGYCHGRGGSMHIADVSMVTLVRMALSGQGCRLRWARDCPSKNAKPSKWWYVSSATPRPTRVHFMNP